MSTGEYLLAAPPLRSSLCPPRTNHDAANCAAFNAFCRRLPSWFSIHTAAPRTQDSHNTFL